MTLSMQRAGTGKAPSLLDKLDRWSTLEALGALGGLTGRKGLERTCSGDSVLCILLGLVYTGHEMTLSQDAVKTVLRGK